MINKNPIFDVKRQIPRLRVGVGAPRHVCQEPETPLVDHYTSPVNTQLWVIYSAPRLLSSLLEKNPITLSIGLIDKLKASDLNLKLNITPKNLPLINSLSHCPQKFHTFTIFFGLPLPSSIIPPWVTPIFLHREMEAHIRTPFPYPCFLLQTPDFNLYLSFLASCLNLIAVTSRHCQAFLNHTIPCISNLSSLIPLFSI